MVYGRDYLCAEVRIDKTEDYVTITTTHGSDFSYRLNDDDPNVISCLSGLKLSTSGVYEEWFCTENDLIIGKIARMNYKNGIIYPESMMQDDIHSEYLIEIDPYTKSDRMLYQTKNHQERVIAYNNRTVYLLKGGTLSAFNVDTTESDILIEGLPEEDDLTFFWRNGYLIVFDADQCESV